MTKAMRTVFMYLFGCHTLIPEDYNDEHPINWRQFRIAVKEMQVLYNTPVYPPADVLTW